MVHSSSGVSVGEGGCSICRVTGLPSGRESLVPSAQSGVGGGSACRGGPGHPAPHASGTPRAFAHPLSRGGPLPPSHQEVSKETSGARPRGPGGRRRRSVGTGGPLWRARPLAWPGATPVPFGVEAEQRERPSRPRLNAGLVLGVMGRHTARGPSLGREGGEAGIVSQVTEPGGHPQLQGALGPGSGRAPVGGLPTRALRPPGPALGVACGPRSPSRPAVLPRGQGSWLPPLHPAQQGQRLASAPWCGLTHGPRP